MNSRAAQAALERAKEQVALTTKKSGSSFYWAMRQLPPQRREAMFAIYAFCRAVDDIADGQDNEAQKCAALEDWREAIDKLYAGAPDREISLALLEPVLRYKLPKEEFLAIIDGMTTDAKGPVVAPSMEDLLLYCRQVAGAVGLLSVHAFGDTRLEARNLAIMQGEALQLTNILRDLKEDAADGRLYLPRELLAEAGMEDLTPQAVCDHRRLPEVCRALAKIAHERFALSQTLIEQCHPKALRPAKVMLEVYLRLLTRLEKADWRDLSKRISLPRYERLWIAIRHGWL